MFDQIKNKSTGSKTRNGEISTTSVNIIGPGTSITGEVVSSGDIRIDGTIKGSVTSKAKVVLGSTGSVEGDIHCQNADISGAVNGISTVQEMMFLKSTARVNGDINTGKLVVEVGASFTGKCNMGPMIKDMNDAEKGSQDQPKEKTA